MSLFFNYATSSQSNSDTDHVACARWSGGESPLLAVAHKSGTIKFYNEEGQEILQPYIRKASCSSTCMEWHCKFPLLAVGYDDGGLVIWTPRNGVVSESKSTHKKPISILKWSPEGTRLITGDRGGSVGVWAPKPTGGLILMSKYMQKVAITHCAFSTRSSTNTKGCPPFFLGSESGEIFFADDLGHCSEVLAVDSGVRFMHYNISGKYLVIITENIVLHKFQISSDMKMVQERKVKLSIRGNGSDLRCHMAGPGLLAAANAESIVRLWNLDNDENYMLSLDGDEDHPKGKDVIRSIAYNPMKRLLTAGTGRGKVYLWRYMAGLGDKHDETAWQALPAQSVALGVFDMMWATGHHSLLAVVMQKSVTILNQHRLLCRTRHECSYVQLSKNQMVVNYADKVFQLASSVPITHVDIDSKHLVISDGDQTEIHAIQTGGLKRLKTFSAKARTIALRGDTLYVAIGRTIRALSLQGVVKSEISFTEEEGGPRLIDVWGKYLVAVTTNNFIRLWDVSLRQPKLIVPKREFDYANSVITCVRVNCSGHKIAILRNEVDAAGLQHHDQKLYVYDVELDRFHEYDFGRNRQPVTCYWDDTEANLLVVQTNTIDLSANKAMDWKEKKGGATYQKTDGEIVTMFATTDYGILLQDHKGISTTSSSLMGIKVPYIYMMNREQGGKDKKFQISVKKNVMRDFMGLEDAKPQEKKDLMKFSYFLTVGNMDEAYRAVKKIDSSSIWENMAHTCIKTKRLDVAHVCLGNMQDASGARAVRTAKEELWREAQMVSMFSSAKSAKFQEASKKMRLDAEVAMLAIQLGMVNDAERLYLESKRYDLLVSLYQACGRWDEAIKVCDKYDRIHLKTTHYLYAQHLEGCGLVEKAMEQYEKAGAANKEIPRMLYDANRIPDLGQYIKKKGDKELYRWWAQYCASIENYGEAMHFYKEAGDWLSVIKVYIHQNKLQDAIDLIRKEGDPASAFHLAQHLEDLEHIKEAIQLYKIAKRHNHGIRLAMAHGMESEMIALALKSEGDKALQLQVAEYFENRGMNEKAVLLYQKGGNLSRAISLCFQAQLFQELRVIAENFNNKTDPALLARCGEFFMKHRQFDKAVALFITAKRTTHALQLCQRHEIKITDKMAEQLSPPKTKDAKELEDRKRVLGALGECLRDQGSYHLACKKFTQAGDKVSAIRCLLKSGDTGKIIYYATMTRKKEIYVLSANYLQNLNWHNNADLMKKIIFFYNKAKAFEKLSLFYDSCAQVEIDEYRDYDKALGAFRESLKFLTKSKKTLNKETKVGALQTKISLVEKFVHARKVMKTQPQEMVNTCNELLERRDVESAIRVGDAFAMLTEYYFEKGDMQKAFEMVESMRSRNIAVHPYLDAQMVQSICVAVGQDPNFDSKEQGVDDDGIGEEIEESVEEDYEG